MLSRPTKRTLKHETMRCTDPLRLASRCPISAIRAGCSWKLSWLLKSCPRKHLCNLFAWQVEDHCAPACQANEAAVNVLGNREIFPPIATTYLKSSTACHGKERTPNSLGHHLSVKTR